MTISEDPGQPSDENGAPVGLLGKGSYGHASIAQDPQKGLSLQGRHPACEARTFLSLRSQRFGKFQPSLQVSAAEGGLTYLTRFQQGFETTEWHLEDGLTLRWSVVHPKERYEHQEDEEPRQLRRGVTTGRVGPVFPLGITMGRIRRWRAHAFVPLPDTALP